MKRLSVILTLTAAMLGFIAPHLAAADNPIDTLGFIVKTQNAKVLQGFVKSSGLEIGPLITYPNPSDEILEAFGCYFIVTIPQELHSIQNSIVDEFETLPGVEYVEPNLSIPVELDFEQGTVQEGFQNTFNPPDTFPAPYTPNDPMFPEQYSKKITQTDWAWNVSTGEGITLAIIDTGAKTDHEDLIDNMDLENAYDFARDTSWVEDSSGNAHGTMVCGVAAAKMDNGKGIAGTAGNATIMPLSLGPYLLISCQAEAIIYAADKGAKIINMSWWSPAETLEEATEYAWGEGLFLCASAGNDNKDTCNHPALYEHVMAVGGTDSQDRRWWDSNYGANVDIYAPADRILTTNTEYGQSLYTNLWSGTSFAAPHVAGLAALIWSVHPDWTNQQVWDKIIESADTITTDIGQVLRMNARKALDIVPGITEHPVAETTEWKVLSSIGQRIVLKYHDLPQGFHASVFDASGRKVDELHLTEQSGIVSWGEGMLAGVYFIRSQFGHVTLTQKVILIQ